MQIVLEVVATPAEAEKIARVLAYELIEEGTMEVLNYAVK